MQLNTGTKMFCSCSALYGGAENSQTCPVCLGLPGTLPSVNKTAVEHGVKAAAALNCSISPVSRFARKNYMYPDLPKGYQISQYDEPLAVNGYLDIYIGGRKKRIGISRIHFEEDAGKLLHSEKSTDNNKTRVDFNRCGVPLLEIVSGPEIESPEEAKEYLKSLKKTLEYLDICDCNMEEGSLRCDANTSIRKTGTKKPGTRTEIKNLNSFRGVEKALRHEIRRQVNIIESGEKISRETLSWDAGKNITVFLRGKEDLEDYRYFPEPDLLPLQITEKMIKKAVSSLPELPDKKRLRFIEQYGLTEEQAEIITSSTGLADFFEETSEKTGFIKSLSKWITGEVLRSLKENNCGISGFPVSPERLAELVNISENRTINLKTAKNIFNIMLTCNLSPEEIVKRNGLEQVSGIERIAPVISRVLADNPDQVKKYCGGKKNLLGFFFGRVMELTGGKADPALVNNLLKKELENLTENSGEGS